ncbi:hypothetical protein ES703_112076 [subsurface metagenome]
MVNDVKIGGGIEFPNKITTQFGPIMIHYHGSNIINIQAQGITEHENQKQWDNKGQIHTPEVPDQVVKFLTGNGLDIYQFQLSLPDINSIKTSLRSASGVSGNTSPTIFEGLPVTTIFPSLIITIRSQFRASSM